MVNFNDPSYGWQQPTYSASQLSGVLGQSQGGSGALGGGPSMWQRLLDPQTALPMAAALIAGKTPQESLAGAFAQAGPALAATDKKLAVNAWLKAGAPKDPNHPATQALFKAAPEMADKVIGQQFVEQLPTSDMQEYALGQKQGFKGTLQDWQAQSKTRAASNPAEDDQIQAISDGIVSGDVPPNKSLYHYTGPVLANLAKRGFNLTKQTEDYTATQKRLSVLNGAQQIKLNQSVLQVEETLPLIEQLAVQWDGSGLKPLNKLNLEAATQGAYGQEAQSIATRLKGAIADMTSELGTVYKGGNASTDETLRLAGENLQADWSAKTLLDNIKQIKQMIVYRKNSMKILTQGTPDNRYDQPSAPEPAAAAPAAPAAPAQGGVVPYTEYFK